MTSEHGEHGLGMYMVLVVFLVIGLGGMYFISAQAKPTNVYLSQEPIKNAVSVSGEAKTKVAPNLVQIAFIVETNDTKSAKTAQEANSEIANRVVAELKSLGLTDKDIETTSFSVQPIKISKYKCPDLYKTCEYYDRIYYEEILGYKATHGFFIKFEDTKKGGELLDAIAIAGTNEVKVNSVSFTLKDETRDQIERELLEKASQDAKNKAQKITAGLGGSVGKVLSASENIIYPYQYRYAPQANVLAAEGDAAKVAATEVFASDIEVSATVSASFEVI